MRHKTRQMLILFSLVAALFGCGGGGSSGSSSGSQSTGELKAEAKISALQFGESTIFSVTVKSVTGITDAASFNLIGEETRPNTNLNEIAGNLVINKTTITLEIYNALGTVIAFATLDAVDFPTPFEGTVTLSSGSPSPAPASKISAFQDGSSGASENEITRNKILHMTQIGNQDILASGIIDDLSVGTRSIQVPLNCGPTQPGNITPPPNQGFFIINDVMIELRYGMANIVELNNVLSVKFRESDRNFDNMTLAVRLPNSPNVYRVRPKPFKVLSAAEAATLMGAVNSGVSAANPWNTAIAFVDLTVTQFGPSKLVETIVTRVVGDCVIGAKSFTVKEGNEVPEPPKSIGDRVDKNMLQGDLILYILGTGSTGAGSGGGTTGKTPIGTLVFHQITSFSERLSIHQGWQPVISDSGNRAVFTSSPGTQDPARPNRIFVVDADGSGLREVDAYRTFCFCGSSVDISADGSTVISSEGVQLRIASAAGGGGRELIAFDRHQIQTIRIAVDGSRVFFNLGHDAFIRGTNDRIERGVYVINSDGSGLQQVASPAQVGSLLGIDPGRQVFFPVNGGGQGSPALDVSSDGSRIIFAANDSRGSSFRGQQSIFTINSDGSGLRRIFGPTSSNGGETSIAISGDGLKVAFNIHSDVTNVREGHVANFDGTGQRRIASNQQFTFTNGNTLGDRITLNTDGSRVIFGGFGHLFNSDGSGVVQLAANATGPSGSPLIAGDLPGATMSSDGSRVLFYFREPGTAIKQLAVLDINPISLGDAPALSDITVNPDVVSVNGASTIRVRVNTANNISYVGNVALLNGLKDSKVTQRLFFDDGVSGGDDVAGDGIFTHNAILPFSDAELGPRILRIIAEVFSADGRLHGTAVAVAPFAVVASP